MECRNIRGRLSAYIDEALSTQEKMAVDEHLKACRECAASLADLKKTVECVKNLESVEPPPWLTQKVMTRVRAESQPRKGLFQKLLYPPLIKLPVGAVATIAIALTTIYVFRTIGPDIKLPKTPAGEMAPQVSQKEQQPSRRDTEADKVAPVSPSLTSPILLDKGRSGEERRLDERKAPAISPEEQVPLKEAERVRDRFEASRKAPEPLKHAELSQEQKPPAPASERDESMPAAGALAKKDAKSEAAPAMPRVKAPAEEKKGGILITVYVKDMESARRMIEKDVMELGGEIIKKESYKDKDILSTKIESKNLKEFYERLMSVGQVKGKDVDFQKLKGEVSLSIELVRIPEER